MKYKCPCCGYYTLPEKADGTYEICQVCFWEDDPIQLHEHDSIGGANGISLNEARQNFIQYGACEKRFAATVRKPAHDELQGLE